VSERAIEVPKLVAGRLERDGFEIKGGGHSGPEGGGVEVQGDYQFLASLAQNGEVQLPSAMTKETGISNVQTSTPQTFQI